MLYSSSRDVAQAKGGGTLHVPCPAPHALVCALPAISFHKTFILQLFDITKI
jgi:hypothetical protein